MTFAAWKIVFFMGSGVFFVGNAIYCLFVSGDVQSWNDQSLSNDGHENSGNYDDRELRILEEKLKLTS